MKFFLSILIMCWLCCSINAQDTNAVSLITLPYYEIPEYPEDFTAGNVASRFVDGLGFRFYWATEGLRAEDLEYKPSDDSRTIRETMDHIFGLSRTISNSTKNIPNVRVDDEEMSFEELRKKTLYHIQSASNSLKGKSAEELAALQVVFKREDRSSEYPLWNLLNGPINDAVYHTGQIVAYRRAAGNPIDFRVSQFRGKIKE